jgi:hypothetical protein
MPGKQLRRPVMVTETLADKIQRIRGRLAEIAAEREATEAEDFARKTELLDEEHTLQARLSELQDDDADLGVGIAQKEAGAASNYERVPPIPDDRSIGEAS